MKEMYSKAVSGLKSKVKHSTEPLPKAVGYRHIREAADAKRAEEKAKKGMKKHKADSVKHSKEDLHKAHAHMKQHGG